MEETRVEQHGIASGSPLHGARFDPDRDGMIAAVQSQVLDSTAEFREFGADSRPHRSGPVDYLFAVENEPHAPDDVFAQLRWGGQFIYISRSREKIASISHRFRERGFAILHGPGYVRRGPFSVWIPFLSQRIYYFMARKIELLLPREISDRFTFHVQLVEHNSLTDHYYVLKEVPTLERVMARLRARFPSLGEHAIETRARKFTDRLFPLFLTREAGILQILERDLPHKYRDRVPHVIDLEQDHRGFVRRLKMNWLRNGGPTLSQLEFARQAAELLHALHDSARVIHLDLRLDNMVITRRGVGFVDFGSSVRVGERLEDSALLSSIFEELMRTSEIQRMLSRMTQTGAVTSSVIGQGLQKVDKAVDLYILALQINYPHRNPDFHGLVQYDQASPESSAILKLTDEILKPSDPHHPRYKSARDVLEGIMHLQATLPRK